MSTIIKGWVQDDVPRNQYDHADEGGSVIHVQRHKELTYDRPCVIVIGDHDEPPVLYTKDDVSNIIKEISQRIQDSIGVRDDHIPTCIVEIHAVCQKNGIKA